MRGDHVYKMMDVEEEAVRTKTDSDSNTEENRLRKLLISILDSYYDSIGFIPAEDVREREYKKVENFMAKIDHK